MLIPLKSLSPVLVMISSMSMSICNSFHARRASIGKITTIYRYLFLTLACAGLIKLKESGLRLPKFAFDAENFIHRFS